VTRCGFTACDVALVVAEPGLARGWREALSRALRSALVTAVDGPVVALDAQSASQPAVIVASLESLGPLAPEGVAALGRMAPQAAVLVAAPGCDPVLEGELLEAGAQEVLSVGPARILAPELRAAVWRASRRHSLVRRVREESHTDPLTGLLNRRGFAREGVRVLGLCRRLGARALLLAWDVDDLKAINDMNGHAAGDAALARVATAVRRALRSSDVAARLGGDEFAALAPHAGTENASAMDARLTEALEAGGVAVTVSAGWAEYDPTRPADLDELLAEADQRLYRTKADRKRAVSGPCPRSGAPKRYTQGVNKAK
jgi:diguanylate cyclase (GGDEF)-like protein